MERLELPSGWDSGRFTQAIPLRCLDSLELVVCMGLAMGSETVHETPKRQLGCECSVELYNKVRERAAATGDSMAGVMRSALVEFLASEPGVFGTLGRSSDTLSDTAAGSAGVSSEPERMGLANSQDLPAVVEAIASSMAAVMRSALVEFLMASPDPLKAVCKASDSTVGDGLWFMAEFLRFYADWSPDAVQAPEVAEETAKEADNEAGNPVDV